MFAHAGPRPLRYVAVIGLVVAVSALTAAPAAAESGHHRDADDSRVQQVNLVSDQPGAAQLTDPNLVNPWGLAAGPTTPIWVSDNGTNSSTLYSGATTPSQAVSAVGLVVAIPGGGAPTGVVFNGGAKFVLSTDGKTGPALFMFAGENGDISAWNQSGVKTKATLVAHTAGAVYKGLALVSNEGKQYLLATNFHDNRIDVFNSQFQPVHRRHAFSSVGIPSGYAPFSVAVLGKQVYVTYAKQNAARHDDVAGAGHGFVSVFNTEGDFIRSFAQRGVLNSPWGMAIAPKGFGDLSGDVLIGNFGDGRIHAFDPRSGELEATLRGANGRALVIDGLWGLLPGNGTAGATSDVWFSAGPGGESHGLLGILRAIDD
jgi:uncharacterized protein (TIGR03118 family)